MLPEPMVKCISPCKDHNKWTDSKSSEDIEPKPMPKTEKIASNQKSEVVTEQTLKNDDAL